MRRRNLVLDRRRSARATSQRRAEVPMESRDAAHEDTSPRSNRLRQQLRQPNQIEGSAREDEQPVHLGQPLSFTLRIQAIVFSHPNAGSIRGRAC